MNIMRILLTGANGLLGHHIAFELLHRGYDVNIVVRSTKKIHFDISRVNVFVGNFGDEKFLFDAANECDAIMHVAAATATHWRNYAPYHKLNVVACETILRVATLRNIHKIIFVSTSNTIGNGSIQFPGTTANAIAAPFEASFYAQSKLAAENLFKNYAHQHPQKHVIIINPCFLIGAYDTKPSSGKLLLMGKGKAWVFVPRGGKNFVAAHDVAVAACNALHQGQTGERYLCGNQNLSFAALFRLQNQVLQQKQRIFVLPNFVLKIAGFVGDLIQKVGFETDLCSRNINQLLVQEYYCSAKTIDALGMPQTPIIKAIDEANRFFDSTNKTISTL